MQLGKSLLNVYTSLDLMLWIIVYMMMQPYSKAGAGALIVRHSVGNALLTVCFSIIVLCANGEVGNGSYM